MLPVCVRLAVVSSRWRRPNRTQQQTVTRGQLVELGWYNALTLPVLQAVHPGYLWKPGAPQVLCRQSKMVHGRNYLPPVLQKPWKVLDVSIPLFLRPKTRRKHLYPAPPIVLQLMVGRVPSLPRCPPNLVTIPPLPKSFNRPRLVHTGRKVQTETSSQGQELA